MILKYIQNFTSQMKASINKLNEKSILITLSTLQLLIENCPNVIVDDSKSIAECLITLNNIEMENIKKILCPCWNSLLKNDKTLINDLYEHLFIFFINNFKIDNYEIKFSSAEFFSFIVDKEENILSNPNIMSLFQNKLPE